MRYIVLLLLILIINVNSFRSFSLINNEIRSSSSLYSYNKKNNDNTITSIKNQFIIPLIISSILTPNIAYAKVLLLLLLLLKLLLLFYLGSITIIRKVF